MRSWQETVYVYLLRLILWAEIGDRSSPNIGAMKSGKWKLKFLNLSNFCLHFILRSKRAKIQIALFVCFFTTLQKSLYKSSISAVQDVQEFLLYQFGND